MTPNSGVISLFTSALLSGRRAVIYSDGEQTRDFTFVANVVSGVLLACDAPAATGEPSVSRPADACRSMLSCAS